jgi:hypothetical protein
MNGATGSGTVGDRTTRIALDVHDVKQLFSTFDPSPFHEFSLNSTAAQYISSQAWYAPRDTRLEIALSIRGKPASLEAVGRLQEVVRAHFTRLAASEDQNFKQLLRTGVISLAIGLCVLAFCTVLSRGVDNSSLPDGWREGLRDGISVFGWVANWRPAQILFYDWWPVRRLRNLYRRLEVATVVAGVPGKRTAESEAVAPLDTMPIEAGPT